MCQKLVPEEVLTRTEHVSEACVRRGINKDRTSEGCTLTHTMTLHWDGYQCHPFYCFNSSGGQSHQTRFQFKVCEFFFFFSSLSVMGY